MIQELSDSLSKNFIKTTFIYNCFLFFLINVLSPEIKVHDTIKYNLVDKKVEEVVKFDLSNTVYITGGNNIGRVG